MRETPAEANGGGDRRFGKHFRKRQLRKNALFGATPNGGETAAILSSLTSTYRRHNINPQAYLTQLLANLPDTPIGELDPWLLDEWKKRQARRETESTSAKP